MEETRCLKPSDSGSRIGDRASVQAATRVNAEQASKMSMCRPARRPLRGRLTRLGEMSEEYAQPLHRSRRILRRSRRSVGVSPFEIHPLMADEFVRRGALSGGLVWHFARPPVQGLDFEVDVRGVGPRIGDLTLTPIRKIPRSGTAALLKSKWDHEFESAFLQRRVSCEPV